MLSPQLNELIREIFGRDSKGGQEAVEKDPEACLITLLTQIKEELPDPSSALVGTVGRAVGREYSKQLGDIRPRQRTSSRK